MKRILSVMLAFALAAVMCGCSLLNGCDFFDSVNFFAGDINGYVGDTIDMEQYIDADTSGGFSLSSSNELVAVVVNHSSIKLMNEGNSEITVKIGSSKASVTVGSQFAPAKTLDLCANNDLAQPENSTKPITFYAVVNEGAKKPSKYEWFVNGTKQSINGDNFTLSAQNGAGAYNVSVSANDITAEQTLLVYKEEQAAVLTGWGGNAELHQSVAYSISGLDGACKTEWYVNGVLQEAQLSAEPEFVFTPQYAGAHEISAKVNGVSALTEGGENCAKLSVSGDIFPQNLRSIDYYSEYPKILLRWGNRNDALTELKITLKGAANSIIIPDINIKDGEFDLSPYVGVTDSFWVGSDFESIYFEGKSQTAKQYLEQKYVGGNLYMRSEEDIRSLFQYMVIFRPNKTGGGSETTSKMSFFMGYDSAVSADRLVNSLVDSLNMTGSYRWQINGSLKANTVNELSITFYTVNEPSDFATATPAALQLIMPYSSKAGRTQLPLSVKTPPLPFETIEDSSLPVASYPLSPVRVSTTDELFFALEKGYKPDLVTSSMAYSAYNDAAKVLNAITDEKMSEAETALAIYDYVMFLTTYDDDATKTSAITDAVKKSAYYLEGVFNTGFAVCDGISKAFSLLCNMAGLRCVRITGLVLQGTSWFNHAWNKVNIDGKWFTADATWDISNREIGTKTYKIGSKGWFLLGESNYYLTRYETGSVYPKAELFEYSHFAKTNAFIFDSGNVTAQLNSLNAFINANYTKSYSMRGVDYIADYYAVEIAFSPSLANSISNKLNSAIKKQCSLFFTQNTVIIAVK